MAKFALTIETEDEGALADEISEKISSELDIDVKSISRLQPHAIYSEGDIPAKVYWNFDGYEDLEFAHLEKQSTSHVDEVISEPLHSDWLHCTCGELNNASPEEAIEHLDEEISTRLRTADLDIERTKIDSQTVVRQGKTGKTRRRTEVVHFDSSNNETVTFMHVRGKSREDAVSKSYEQVMFADEWGMAEVVHTEGKNIYVIRLSCTGSPDELTSLEIGSTDNTPEMRMRNRLTDEMLSFVSLSANSADEALENNPLDDMIGSDIEDQQIVHKENGIYVVRG